MAPLTPVASGDELSCLRSELLTIEGLLSDVLRRKSSVLSRLDALTAIGPNSSTPVAGPSTPLSPSWATVVKRGKRRALPLFSPGGLGGSVLLSNSTLAALSESEPPVSLAPPASMSTVDSVEREANANAELTAPSLHAEAQQVRSGTTRKRSCPPLTPTILHKRTRHFSPPPLRIQFSPNTSNRPESVSPPPTVQIPQPTLVTAVEIDDVTTNNRGTPEPELIYSPLSSTDSVMEVPVSETAPSVPPRPPLINNPLLAWPKLIVHKGLYNNPELLIIGDSTMRDIEIPGGITFCLPGGRISDVSKLAPTLIDLYPSVHTVFIHFGTNSVQERQSAKHRQNLEALAINIESLNKTCVFSGPIPAPSKSAEHFSRLHSLHEWLKAFCTATGYGYIDNFDTFWTRNNLYKSDGLHPNSTGIRQLTMNFIRHVAFKR